jgi:small-conductance mechanosensitive channel
MNSWEHLKDQTAMRALIVVGITAFGWVFSGIVSRYLARVAARNFDSHQTMLIKRLSYYVLFALSFITGLNEAGINLSVVVGAAGVASVAVGFASQTSMSNLISGVFMIIEKPFMVGDVIKVGATTGEVASMGLLSTILKTPENIMVRIPNENLMKSEIANVTRFPVRKVEFAVPLGLDADLAKVRSIILNCVTQLPEALKDPAPAVAFKGFTDRSQDILVSAWGKGDGLKDLTYVLPTKVSQALNEHKIAKPSLGGHHT